MWIFNRMLPREKACLLCLFLTMLWSYFRHWWEFPLYLGYFCLLILKVIFSLIFSLWKNNFLNVKYRTTPDVSVHLKLVLCFFLSHEKMAWVLGKWNLQVSIENLREEILGIKYQWKFLLMKTWITQSLLFYSLKVRGDLERLIVVNLCRFHTNAPCFPSRKKLTKSKTIPLA